MDNYNNVLIELQNFILTNDNIKNALQIKCLSIDKNKKTIKKNPERLNENKKIDLFRPMEEDSLFWCFFIMKNGLEKYETLYYKNSVLTKQLKIDLIMNLRKKKDVLKMYKFDSITNIENNLANENILNLKTFFSLCAIENLNVFYTYKKTYFEVIMNNENLFYNIQEVSCKSNYIKKYGFTIEKNETLICQRNTLFKINNIEKPIKSLSFYKVADLIEICNKLFIEIIDKNNGKNKSKNKLYESIIQYF